MEKAKFVSLVAVVARNGEEKCWESTERSLSGGAGEEGGREATPSQALKLEREEGKVQCEEDLDRRGSGK